MAKPGKFRKMIEQEYEKWLYGDMSQSGWLQVADRCMDRQHRAYVRIIQKARRIDRMGRMGSDGRQHVEINKEDGAYIRRDEVLAAFARYKKGTKHG